MNGQDQRNLMERCRQPIADESVQDNLLTRILESEDCRTLEELAAAVDCEPLLRSAALDRCYDLESDELEALARRLVDHQTEPSEEVRLEAARLLTSIEADASRPRTQAASAVRTRGAVRVRARGMHPVKGDTAEDWRERAGNDPSPAIRWLAGLTS